MIWADHIQKSVFRHSGTLWLPRRFSAIICFLLRARFKKIMSNIYHDSKIYNRIAFGTSFSYLKAFPSPSPGCPGMTNQLFSKHYQGVLPSLFWGLGKIIPIHNFGFPDDIWLLRLRKKVKHSFYIYTIASGPKIKPRNRKSLSWGRKNLQNSFVIPGQRGHKNLVTNIATLFLMLV